MIKNHCGFKFKNKLFVLIESDVEVEPYVYSFNGIQVIAINEKLAKWEKQLGIHKCIKAALRGKCECIHQN